jgi:hypothetical protein
MPMKMAVLSLSNLHRISTMPLRGHARADTDEKSGGKWQAAQRKLACRLQTCLLCFFLCTFAPLREIFLPFSF